MNWAQLIGFVLVFVGGVSTGFLFGRCKQATVVSPSTVDLSKNIKATAEKIVERTKEANDSRDKVSKIVDEINALIGRQPS